MKILLLLPAFIYVIIIFMNTGLLSIKHNLNIFWIYEIELPLIAFITIFFVLYILFIWLVLKFTNLFSSIKNKKLEKEIWDLKSKLLDWQENLLEWINKNFEAILKKSLDENDKRLNLYKKENDKVVWNLEYKMDSIWTNISKLKK